MENKAKPRFSIGRQTRQMLMLLTPALVLIGGLSVFPVVRGILMGFTNYRIGMPTKFNGFDNYIKIANNGYLWVAFKNTLLMVIFGLALTYVISIVLSLLLNSDIPFRKFWRILLIIPWAVPPVAKVGVWKNIFNTNNGMLNYILKELGAIEKYIPWLAMEQFALGAIITVVIWGCIPFTTMSFLAAMQGIPSENYEAAQLDGANPLHCFFYITLPYLRDISMVTVSLLFMWIANDFTSAYLLTGGGPGSATLTIPVESYFQGFKYGNFGLATAYGNVMVVFCSVVLYFYIRMISEKEKVK